MSNDNLLNSALSISKPDKPISLLVAIRKHLMLEGEGMTAVKEQWAKLTDLDKTDLVQYFNEADIHVVLTNV